MFVTHKKATTLASDRPTLPWWVVGSIAIGTLLNPVNEKPFFVDCLLIFISIHLIEMIFASKVTFNLVTLFQTSGCKITTGILRVVRLAYASHGGF
jgi:hypothetical protein